jgi:hypothetical protein
MSKLVVKHRRKLNAEQLEVLELLYKFRFGSNDLIAQYFGRKDRSFVFKRLAILQELGLIGKRFEPSYRIQGKPAAYYLLPEGARTVKKNRDPEDTDEVNIKSVYKDASVSDGFIKHCLHIFALYNTLNGQYDDLDFLATRDIAGYEYYPQPLPDAFLTLDIKHYFLQFLEDDQPFFTVVRKIKSHIEYCKSGNWSQVGGESKPTMLFVCESASLQKRTQKRIMSALRKELSDFAFAVTTMDAVADDEWLVAPSFEETLPLSDI